MKKRENKTIANTCTGGKTANAACPHLLGSGKRAAVTLSLKNRDLDAVRYAAYAVSDAAYIFMRSAGKNAVTIEFTPKHRPEGSGRGPHTDAENLIRRFREELNDEKIRSAIFDSNRDLREFMILKALSYDTPSAQTGQDDSGLTPEQEKELDALIAQVESEIRKESAGNRVKDPLGITRTWEEKYGAKPGREKNRQTSLHPASGAVAKARRRLPAHE